MKELIKRQIFAYELRFWGKYRKLSVLFIIAAIVCALFAYRIDAIVKGDRKVKRIIIAFSVCLIDFHNINCISFS